MAEWSLHAAHSANRSSNCVSCFLSYCSDWTQRGLSSTRFCCERHPKQNRNRNLVNSKQSRQHGCFRSTVLTQIRWRPSAGAEDIFFYFSHFVYRELLIPVNFHFMFITSEEICLASSQPLQVSNRTSSAAAYSQPVLSRPSWGNKDLQRRADREPLSCGFLLCRKPRPQRAIILRSGPAGGPRDETRPSCCWTRGADITRLRRWIIMGRVKCEWVCDGVFDSSEVSCGGLRTHWDG